MSRESEIVEVFRRLVSEKQSFTAQELNARWQPENYRGSLDPIDQSRMSTVYRALRTLEALGLIKRTQDGTFQVEAPEQGATLTDAVDGPPAVPPPQRGDGQGNNGQSGDGFREVLSHPYLFALLPSDFERLLETIE
ncbi:hypothetical protein N0K08_09290 [Acidovorax sp. Be4]|uniref:Uncharacterized protein n=1 Tax=Acidovorax bellezanensis TaxID=2976702 RepID=A0ABT2PKR7_9BURK|nr:hypothetical protein [Acidovorax sp. Be4]MCT9810828.1 hypothetical protein [Acidovorax sp. Be4]